MKKTKINLSNIKAYLQGKIRYRLYYNRYLKWLLRKHIREQIQWRIAVMDPTCYEQGSCTICGCDTTALQMANKACPKPCYPAMMNKKEWDDFKLEQFFKREYPISPYEMINDLWL